MVADVVICIIVVAREKIKMRVKKEIYDVDRIKDLNVFPVIDTKVE